MRRLLVAFGLLLALAVSPAWAQDVPFGQSVPGAPAATLVYGVQAPGCDPSATLQLGFTTNSGSGLYCLKGTRYGRFLDVPGASFSRASTKTALTSSGAVVSFASGVPAITDLGLLVEGAGTNLLLWSQDPTNAAWIKNNGAVAGATTLAPDGTLTASTFTATAGNAFHYLNRTGFSYVAGSYVHTFFVKRNNNDWVFFTVDDSQISYFNMATGVFGTLGTGVTATAKALTNGWYMIAAIQTETARSAAGFGVGIASANGGAQFTATGSEALYVWAQDGKQDSAASSYIPTTSAIVTRAADVAVLTASLGTQGTLLAIAARTTNTAANARLIGPTSGSAIPLRATTALDAMLTTNGTTSLSVANALPATVKAAVAWDGTGRSITVSGLTPATDANTFTNLSAIQIGADGGAGGFWNAPIQRVVLYPTRLTDAQLQALTQ